MKPALRKLALTAHVATSVGWLGAAVAFLAHAVVGLTTTDNQMVRAAYLMMESTGWYVLVPLSLASLVTGLLQSLGTKWGLFQHYWVVMKLAITVFATAILLVFMRGFGQLASFELQSSGIGAESHGHGKASPALHAGLGILVLLLAVILSIYKPWGKTPYGRGDSA